jgi:hypothetical protein
VKSLAKPRVPNSASGYFTIKPTADVQRAGNHISCAITRHRAHRSPSSPYQVLNNESQALLSIQDFSCAPQLRIYRKSGKSKIPAEGSEETPE